MARTPKRRGKAEAETARTARRARTANPDGATTDRSPPTMDSGMQRQGDLNPQRRPDTPDTAGERNTRAANEAQARAAPSTFVGENQDAPRFDDDGNPIDANGRPRALDPGEAPQDDVDRELYTVGKGGTHVRGKLYVEGETVLLSEEEANMIEDQGNHVTHVDPVEAKAVAERYAERNKKRREAQQKDHAEAQKQVREQF